MAFKGKECNLKCMPLAARFRGVPKININCRRLKDVASQEGPKREGGYNLQLTCHLQVCLHDRC